MPQTTTLYSLNVKNCTSPPGGRPVRRERGRHQLHQRDEGDAQPSGESSTLHSVGLLQGNSSSQRIGACTVCFLIFFTLCCQLCILALRNCTFSDLLCPFPRVAAPSACWTPRLSPPLCGTCSPSFKSSSAAWQEQTCKQLGTVVVDLVFFWLPIAHFTIFFPVLTKISDSTGDTRLCSALRRHWSICHPAGGKETLESVQPKV